MERTILPYGGLPAHPSDRAPAPGGPPTLSVHAGHPTGFGHAPGHPQGQGKGAGDYLRALRRRFWLLTLVTGLLATIGTVAVLKLKPVYRASAQIEVMPPQFDSILASLLADEEINLNAMRAEQYEANLLARLRNPQIVRIALKNPRIGPPIRSEEDPAIELIKELKTNQLPRTSVYDIHLEGDDPYRVSTILNVWLEEYERAAESEVTDKIDNSRIAAENNVKKMYDELDRINRDIGEMMAQSPNLSPDGTNHLHKQYESLGLEKRQKQISIDQLQHQLFLARMFPKEQAPHLAVDQREMSQLMEDRRALDLKIDQVTRIVRNPRDPAINRLMNMKADLDDQLHALRDSTVQAASPRGEPAEAYFSQYREVLTGELTRITEEEQAVMRDIQRGAADHNRFNTKLEERLRTAEAIASLQAKIDQFEVLSKTQNKPVEVVQLATASTKPVRPGYTMLLVLVGLMSMGSGLGLVFLLEHLDHSVRAPEQLTTGLTLPLLGVVPHMRRTARLQRGGHLWTAGAPMSAEADAYRNLRASLVGLTCPQGKPAVTLLVTSSKAGEGKSTTALNLAATCARSGERTLLLEVDLRRPSLRPVFDEGDHDLGLVDVLRGEMPWQRTVVRTDEPNLDFLPSGDPSGVPVEVLGALEMKQLIAAVSGHYDRVILDGPAILGLADCRMLGRVVDAAVLVVRAGANDLRPVVRARTMLEQSRAPIVGVVFNGLCEDVKNWSCVSAYLDEEAEADARALPARPGRAAGALAAAD
ncbi:polysaccharide biosynthesis tyrosine autokinase [Tautonia plasticadhaerens]|uniref:Tyrosine-protein kinase YwqD n=1 Tax=Tautonia plasticadhaerens TaxID=2527974 RepID=A0A518GYX7_9BACT|nr:polysaccharide biosynthesis tyrosine autokinase [Tautonia plasticadhaerens]QDV33814.1 Tyrosine-protein kinase YwqD [Tautonia plasticadhaerens]